MSMMILHDVLLLLLGLLATPTASFLLLESPNQIRPAKIPVVQRSSNPLILCSESSTPLLNPDECELLKTCCLQLESKGRSVADLLSTEDDIINSLPTLKEGSKIMKKLQRKLACNVIGCQPEDPEALVVPRFLHYQSLKDVGQKVSTDLLLEDGLHVDTNNGKFFRHWTILFYLDNLPEGVHGGATTFPLSERVDDEALASAQQLVNSNIHHTRISKNPTNLELGRKVEQVALDLCQGQCDTGVRILPRQGHFCLFSGLLHDGTPNPRSFHAAETMISPFPASRNVLSFFYEVPLAQFSNRAEMGDRVREREEALLEFHRNNVTP